MKSGGLLQNIHGRVRRVRSVSLAAMLLLLSAPLLIGQQAFCTPLSSQFVQHDHESGIVSAGVDGVHCSTDANSENDWNNCAGSDGSVVAKSVPAIRSAPPSPNAVVFAETSLPEFAAIPRSVLPSVHYISPLPYSIYLRFLHLLI